MTSSERLLTALARWRRDRVPIGFEAHEGVQRQLMAHYGAHSRRELFAKMGIDGFSIFQESYVSPTFAGPAPKRLEDGTTCDFWGIDFHQRNLPLAFAESAAELDQYAWPSAEIGRAHV